MGLVVMLVGVVPNVHATKTGPPLPIQLTSSPATVKPGDTVDYLLHIPNKSSNGYWGVKGMVNFPATLSCTQIVSANRGGCSLVNNVLTCSYKDIGDWWILDVVVRCQVKQLPTCSPTIVTTGGVWVDKPKQDTRANHTLKVNCAPPPTPTPRPSSTCCSTSCNSSATSLLRSRPRFPNCTAPTAWP